MRLLNLDRHSRARLAMRLAQPHLLFAWIVPFGVMALISFVGLFVALLVPTVSLHWIPATTQALSGLMLLTLLARSVLLRQGWMPVSAHDLTHALALAEQPYPVQEALLHAWAKHRWLTWAQVWAIRGRPEGFDALFEGQAWTVRGRRPDRIASVAAARACLPLAVNRKADLVALTPATPVRRRQRA